MRDTGCWVVNRKIMGSYWTVVNNGIDFSDDGLMNINHIVVWGTTVNVHCMMWLHFYYEILTNRRERFLIMADAVFQFPHTKTKNTETQTINVRMNGFVAFLSSHLCERFILWITLGRTTCLVADHSLKFLNASRRAAVKNFIGLMRAASCPAIRYLWTDQFINS